MAKKEKKAKLPKRLAGVKIPKTVRQKLTDLARNPMVADLLAAGLVALAASLRDSSKAAPAKAAEPAEDKPEPAAAAPAKRKRAQRAPAAAKPATQTAKPAAKAGAKTTRKSAAPPPVRKAPRRPTPPKTTH